jgi:hypothetical protein
LPPVCRRALLVAPLVALVLLAGCRPAYERRPWTLAFQYDDSGQRLPTVVPMGGPFFHRALQPEGAAPSPTGTHLLLVTQTGELWLYDVLKAQLSQLAAKGVRAQFWPEVSPWSPDGKAMVYSLGGNLIYERLGGGHRQLTQTSDVFTAAISPDGTQVAYGRRDAKDQDQGLWVVPVAGGEPREVVPATNDIFHACCPHWSPDGKWIAFLQAFEGGALGVVSADGKELRQGRDAAWEPLLWLPDSSAVLYPSIIYGEPGDGVHRYDVASDKLSVVAAGGRTATCALSADATRVLVASWHEASDGKVSDSAAETVEVATGATTGESVKLAGAARSCFWAPDGRQVALLVDDAQGHGTVMYGAAGLGSLQPQTAGASALAGWVRLWQPPRPWWRFWG